MAWVSLFLLLFGATGVDGRSAFLAASVVWGVCVTFLTEMLSMFGGVNLPCLAAGWLAISLAAGAAIPRLPTAFRPIPELPGLERDMLLAIAAVCLATLLQAIVSPPNTVDSLTYHMSRVMHWAQAGSVHHFRTNILRQIELNPWAEFAILQFQILSGGDRLANLVQWFCLPGCSIGASLVAGLLGAGRRGELLAGLLTATLPLAVLQASSSQNDLVVSFWLLCFVTFGILSGRESSWLWAALMAASLALAILTKATAYLLGFPFVLWFLARDAASSWRRAALKMLLLGTVVLTVNIGHYRRNYQLFRNPLHSGTDPYLNSRCTPSLLLSNVTRNLAIHLLTPFHAMNRYPVAALESLHVALGIPLYDTATTWPGTTFERLRFSPHEDSSGNPCHFSLFAGTFWILCRKRRSDPLVFRYATTVLSAFLLFCLVLRWQPWNSRLHLPLFILFGAAAGVVLEGSMPRLLTRGVVHVVSALALTWIVLNHSRPMLSLAPLVETHPPAIFTTNRRMLYLNNLPPDMRQQLVAATDRIRTMGIRNLALMSSGDLPEYPVWALTRDGKGGGPRIEYVEVHNASGSLPQTPFTPDATLTLRDAGVLAVTRAGTP